MNRRTFLYTFAVSGGVSMTNSTDGWTAPAMSPQPPFHLRAEIQNGELLIHYVIENPSPRDFYLYTHEIVATIASMRCRASSLTMKIGRSRFTSCRTSRRARSSIYPSERSSLRSAPARGSRARYQCRCRPASSDMVRYPRKPSAFCHHGKITLRASCRVLVRDLHEAQSWCRGSHC